MSSGHLAILAMDCQTWYLFVRPLDGPFTEWPEYRWEDGDGIPAPVQRRAALAHLGYQTAPGAEWEWTEINPDCQEELPVALLAAVNVEPVGGGQR